MEKEPSMAELTSNADYPVTATRKLMNILVSLVTLFEQYNKLEPKAPLEM